MLTLRDGSLAVAERALLQGIALHIAPGEIVALRGPSGCGKTTLLRALAGLIDFATGDLRLDERPPSEWGWPRWRREVSLVAQRPVVFPGTLLENLERPHHFAIGSGEFDQDRAGRLLERVALPADRLGDDARALSVGEAQRLSLVRALLLSPRVLLLDEPTSALDPPRRDLVEALMREEADAGRGLLVASHDPAFVKRVEARHVDLGRWVAND